jgi:dihydroorotate dehydrogenase (fumarate)
MVTKIENLKKAEDAGIAAVVYKSLFEEQIQRESAQLEDELDEYNERNAEMVKIFPDIKHAGPEEHLLNLRKAKESVGIPVIASLNAVFKESWIEYARLIQQTGVDALECNFFYVPRDTNVDGESIINEQLDILKELIQKVKIPVSVKLSPFYANPLNIIDKMDKAGVKGFVLFNRMFQPDIDVNKEQHFTPLTASNQEEHKLALRFAGLLYGNLKASICSNSGIHTGEDVVKMLLAGADCVQIVSTAYQNGISYISTIIEDISNWMEAKGYSKPGDFRGRLSNKNINDPFVYKRAQYIDLLLHSEQILKRNTMV